MFAASLHLAPCDFFLLFFSLKKNSEKRDSRILLRLNSLMETLNPLFRSPVGFLSFFLPSNLKSLLKGLLMLSEPTRPSCTCPG